MKPSLKLFCGALAAALLSLASAAQASECARARDAQRCEARQKAKEVCKGKPAAERDKCVIDAMPPMDCGKARDPQRCEAMQKAKDACKDKPAAEYWQCLREQKRAGAKLR